ncbi:hypothetical protein [Fervidibacillus halotolerans]|uniref:Uncharacterized protein n=1 Tax=Fervidibacillus halotolerans TaxID=2980027 RepID=A0A9E8RYB3_9BACI|nr:hypothetical protein [Fervidibacillus halotolerans]WAA13635.1 hypothetical protein OE105_05910 [Fervidibacillus halotolerans]
MKRFTAFIVPLIIFLCFSTNVKADDATLSVSYELGANGFIQSSEGFPIWFTVKNEGDHPFDGQLIVYFQIETSSRAAKVLPVYVGPGESKRYYTSLPRVKDQIFRASTGRDDIELYEGDWADGTKVSFTGDKKLTVNIIDYNRLFVGVLSENSERLKNWWGITSDQFHWSTLSRENLPRDSVGLEMFDVLIVDEYPLSTLERDQIEALDEWINRGGVLLIGATSNAKQAYGTIYEQLPMKLETEEMVTDVKLKKGNVDVHLDDLVIFTGPVEDGKIIRSHNDHPLILEKTSGSGKIIQTSFSLGDHPDVSTVASAEYFMELLKTAITSSLNTKNRLNNIYWELGELNELFGKASLSPFHLLVILLLYTLVLVPGLYFFLKRIDKREYAWWIIPTISLVISISLFLYGGKDRMKQPLQNELGFFISEGEQLNGYYLVSFQSNKSGEYELKTNKTEFRPMPIGHSSYFRNFQSIVAYITENQGEMNLTYSDVPYWSINSLIGKANKSLDHSFVYDLSINNNRLKGKITNLYPFDFEEVFIWSGVYTYPLGSVKQGEEKSVDIVLQSPWLTKPASDSYVYMNEDNLTDTLKKRLMYNVTGLVPYSKNQSVIAGFTEDAVIDVEMAKKNEKKNSLSIVIQPFSLNRQAFESFTITERDITFDIFKESGISNTEGKLERWMEMPYWRREVILEEGIFQLIFYLPENLKDITPVIDELTIEVQMMESDQYSILNVKNDTFLPLNEFGNIIKFTDDANEYISDDGTITLQLEKTSNMNPNTYMPQLTVKGRVAND